MNLVQGQGRWRHLELRRVKPVLSGDLTLLQTSDEVQDRRNDRKATRGLKGQNRWGTLRCVTGQCPVWHALSGGGVPCHQS
jgi:hypothetical protein